MFLVYILDLPNMFHVTCGEIHDPEAQRKCKEPNAKTFVDDTFIKVTKKEDESMEKAVLNTMVKVECYMKANKLALNSDKSQVMVVSNNTEIKKNFEVIMNGKKVRHKEHINDTREYHVSQFNMGRTYNESLNTIIIK